MPAESVYIESTIFSYLAAREPRDPVLAAHHQTTREWWDRDRARYRLVTSATVLREIAAGDEEMAGKRMALAEGIELLQVSDPVIALAESLIARGLVPRTVADDALHLAVASIGRADYLATWNFRHMAGAVVRRRIENELRRLGYDPPAICTPEELKAAYDGFAHHD